MRNVAGTTVVHGKTATELVANEDDINQPVGVGWIPFSFTNKQSPVSLFECRTMDYSVNTNGDSFSLKFIYVDGTNPVVVISLDHGKTNIFSADVNGKVTSSNTNMDAVSRMFWSVIAQAMPLITNVSKP